MQVADDRSPTDSLTWTGELACRQLPPCRDDALPTLALIVRTSMKKKKKKRKTTTIQPDEADGRLRRWQRTRCKQRWSKGRTTITHVNAVQSPSQLPQARAENIVLASLDAAKNTFDVKTASWICAIIVKLFTARSATQEVFLVFNSKNAIDCYTVLGIMKLLNIASSSNLMETLHKSLQHNRTQSVWLTWYGHCIRPPLHPQSNTVSVSASSPLVGTTYFTSPY